MTQIMYEMCYWDGIEWVDRFEFIFPKNEEETEYWKRTLWMNPECVKFIVESYPEYVI